MAIGYAGAVATLWTCIIPALLAWKVRAGKGNQGGDGFRAPGGLPMIVAVFLFGVLTALFHLLNMAGLLPVYTG
ncbi:Tryptophan-specific transport protein [compost metagenome]